MRVAVLLLALLFIPLSSAGERDVVEVFVCVQPVQETHCYEGMPEAAVTVTGAGRTWTATAYDHGGVRFAALPDGTYTVTATHPLAEPGHASFTVPDDRHVEVRVTPRDVRLHGHIVDEALRSVAGASVLVHGPSMNLTIVTGSDGRFEATVPAGRFWAEIQATGHLRGWADGFANGQEHRWMLLQATPGDAVLTGMVRDQHGAPVAGAQVSAWTYESRHDRAYGDRYDRANITNGYTVVSNPWSRDEAQTQSHPDGTYELRLPSGRGHVQAWAEGHREAYQDLRLAAGPNVVDLQVWRLPDRDARLTGRITHATTGAAITDVSLSVHHVELEAWECSSNETHAPMAGRMGWHGCAITLRPDGTFEGDLMPGYSILQVGGYSCDAYDCRQSFVRHVQTIDLPSGTTHLDIRMVPRPLPDAGVSGYVLDAQGRPIQGARISFHNEEMDGYGHASTDQDGSYRVKLRQGWHTVNVWAPGQLPWEGMVKAVSGRETPLDVALKAGEPACCGHMRGIPYPHHGPVPMLMPAMHVGATLGLGSEIMYLDQMEFGDGMYGEPAMGPSAAGSDGGTASGQDFEDLRGGLGPYDAAARQATIEAQQEGAASRGVPGFLLVPVLALLFVAWRRR